MLCTGAKQKLEACFRTHSLVNNVKKHTALSKVHALFELDVSPRQALVQREIGCDRYIDHMNDDVRRHKSPAHVVWIQWHISVVATLEVGHGFALLINTIHQTSTCRLRTAPCRAMVQNRQP